MTVAAFCALMLGASQAWAAPSADASVEHATVITEFPDQSELQQIIDMGMSGRHRDSLTLAHHYIGRHQDHPCGSLAAGMVHEWEIEAQMPKPYLGPAIEAFEAAGKIPNKPRTDGRIDVTANICRGAALMRLVRIYYKYGENMTAVRRGISGAHELEYAAKLAPTAYDVYAFLGPYHYFTDRSPRPVRWIMRLFGLKGDSAKGIRELETAWTKASLFKNEAGQILYAISANYEGDYVRYRAILAELRERFPENRVFERMENKARQNLASTSVLDGGH